GMTTRSPDVGIAAGDQLPACDQLATSPLNPPIQVRSTPFTVKVKLKLPPGVCSVSVCAPDPTLPTLSRTFSAVLVPPVTAPVMSTALVTPVAEIRLRPLITISVI